MENNQKPEWFELADNDQPENRPLRSRLAAPKRNLTLILALVLVLPTGAGFALLSKDDESASAAETVNLTQDAQSTANTSPAQSNMAITMPTGARDDDEEGDDEGGKLPNTTSSSPLVATKAPAKEIIAPPTKRSDDDDDEKKSDSKESKESDHDENEGEDD